MPSGKQPNTNQILTVIITTVRLMTNPIPTTIMIEARYSTNQQRKNTKNRQEFPRLTSFFVIHTFNPQSPRKVISILAHH